MYKEIELKNMQHKLQAYQININNYYTKNARLHSDYDIGISRKNQLERELMDVLHYKKNIMEKVEMAECCATGRSSRLGKIKIARPGQLEGHFFERMQSRLDERRRKQSGAVEAIKDNLREIKRKSELIEDEIVAARKYVLEIDNLISTNQSNIQATKVQIAQLQGNIRMYS